MSHHMQYLVPQGITVTGDTPDRDPDYGHTHRTVGEAGALAADIQEEVDFDGIETSANGDVHLTLKGSRVARVALTSYHADARLTVLDPR